MRLGQFQSIFLSNFTCALLAFVFVNFTVQRTLLQIQVKSLIFHGMDHALTYAQEAVCVEEVASLRYATTKKRQ